ncbi:MAG: phage terminase small subunit P27 family [Bacilli bacterium]|uniref:phage terminase small subunit P27 family n=1 Tax=Clostridium sp. TaxID=1506 RepID=UPI002FC5A1C3
MARPRKTVNSLQGHVSKKEIEERLEREKRITGDSDCILPPKFIHEDEVALEEFYRVVDELKKVNIATNIDSVMLGIYADSYSKYVQSTIAMRDEELVTEYTNKGGATNAVINPYIKIQQQYATMIMKISALYGFDPSSRSKIAHLSPSDKEEKEDPLVALLSGMRR